MITVTLTYTGGSCLSCTAVKLDSHLAQIFFCQISFYNEAYYNNWISWIMLKPDRFSCSQKIWLKWDPPVVNKCQQGASPVHEVRHHKIDMVSLNSPEYKCVTKITALPLFVQYPTFSVKYFPHIWMIQLHLVGENSY